MSNYNAFHGPRPASRIKATGLWKHLDKNNTPYFEGTLSPTVKVFIFKNGKKKDGSREPDYEMFFSSVVPKDEQPSEEPEADREPRRKSSTRQKVEAPYDDDDDLIF
jgi:hypothetical protein